MICDDNFAAADDYYNDEYHDGDDDDIDDDGKLIMHDCVYRDDDECDDHRYAGMCQFALWRIFIYVSHDVFLHCDCRMHFCACMRTCISCVWCGGMKCDGDVCAFMKTCVNAHDA